MRESVLPQSRQGESRLMRSYQVQLVGCRLETLTPACSDSVSGSKRVEGIKSDGAKVRVQKLAPGEFQSAEDFSRVSYEVNLAIPRRPADLSHVSSLNSEQGVLMLADLLPQYTRNPSVVISFDTPTGWTVASNVRNAGFAVFLGRSGERQYFCLVPSVHETRRRIGKTDFSVITTGTWPFSESDARENCRKDSG